MHIYLLLIEKYTYLELFAYVLLHLKRPDLFWFRMLVSNSTSLLDHLEKWWQMDNYYGTVI